MLKNYVMSGLVGIPLALASCNRDPKPAKETDVQPEPAKKKDVQQVKITWPPLPTKGFIKGRAATTSDIATGDAAFVLKGSKPIDILIPQYAYHVDDQTGKRSAGIIIQAERAPDGKEIAAMQFLGESENMIGAMQEFQLLGKIPPKTD